MLSKAWDFFTASFWNIHVGDNKTAAHAKQPHRSFIRDRAEGYCGEFRVAGLIQSYRDGAGAMSSVIVCAEPGDRLCLGGIQAWLGHRSITSTAVYSALAPNRFKDFWRD